MLFPCIFKHFKKLPSKLGFKKLFVFVFRNFTFGFKSNFILENKPTVCMDEHKKGIFNYKI